MRRKDDALLEKRRSFVKQIARDMDKARLESKLVSAETMRFENHIFAPLDLPTFRIAMIGNQEIPRQKSDGD